MFITSSVTVPELYSTSRAGEVVVCHDLLEHLQRRRASVHAPPLVRGYFVTGAENAQVREPARVLIQTGRPAVDVIGPEALGMVPV